MVAQEQQQQIQLQPTNLILRRLSVSQKVMSPLQQLPSPTPCKSSQLLQPSHILIGRLWCSAGQYDAGACRVRWQPPACSQIVWGSLTS